MTPPVLTEKQQDEVNTAARHLLQTLITYKVPSIYGIAYTGPDKTPVKMTVTMGAL